MNQAEAMQRIATEYPEFMEDALQIVKDGRDLVEFVTTLDSLY